MGRASRRRRDRRLRHATSSLSHTKLYVGLADLVADHGLGLAHWLVLSSIVNWEEPWGSSPKECHVHADRASWTALVGSREPGPSELCGFGYQRTTLATALGDLVAAGLARRVRPLGGGACIYVADGEARDFLVAGLGERMRAAWMGKMCQVVGNEDDVRVVWDADPSDGARTRSREYIALYDGLDDALSTEMAERFPSLGEREERVTRDGRAYRPKLSGGLRAIHRLVLSLVIDSERLRVNSGTAYLSHARVSRGGMRGVPEAVRRLVSRYVWRHAVDLLTRMGLLDVDEEGHLSVHDRIRDLLLDLAGQTGAGSGTNTLRELVRLHCLEHGAGWAARALQLRPDEVSGCLYGDLPPDWRPAPVKA